MNQLNISSNSKVTISEIGLVVHKELTDKEHKQLWESLLSAEKGIRWCLGDYLNHCEDVGRGYDSLMESTGYCRGSLKESKSLAKRFPIEQRNKNLTYSFHKEALAECKGDTQVAIGCLDYAEKNNLTISEMRKNIRTLHSASNNNPTPKPEHESDKVDKVFCEVVRNLQSVTTQLGKVKLSRKQYETIILMTDGIQDQCEESL